MPITPMADDAGCVPVCARHGSEHSPWGDADFACCLTHDIDHLDKYVSGANWARSMAADILRRGSPLRLVRRFREGPRGTSYQEGFEWLLAEEKRRRISATYFFLAHEDPPPGEYRLTDALSMIRAAEDAGMEAGLHASCESYRDIGALAAEKARFDAVVRNRNYGIRQHFLNLDVPETWRMQASLGFLYDSSFGNAEREGHRSGACQPFRPLDSQGSEIGIWEIPLTVMDGTLAQYRGLSPGQGFDAVKPLVLETRKKHGVFCLLWHNSSLDSVDWNGWRDVYLRILDLVTEQRGWIASGREIIERWESQES